MGTMESKRSGGLLLLVVTPLQRMPRVHDGISELRRGQGTVDHKEKQPPPERCSPWSPSTRPRRAPTFGIVPVPHCFAATSPAGPNFGDVQLPQTHG